jgi:hypothetical protein
MIQYKDFIIRKNGYERYDLYRFAIINKDTKKEREGEYAIAYAQTFQKVLEDILIILVDKKCAEEEISSIRGYIDAYRLIVDEVLEAGKNKLWHDSKQ